MQARDAYGLAAPVDDLAAQHEPVHGLPALEQRDDVPRIRPHSEPHGHLRLGRRDGGEARALDRDRERRALRAAAGVGCANPCDVVRQRPLGVASRPVVVRAGGHLRRLAGEDVARVEHLGQAVVPEPAVVGANQLRLVDVDRARRDVLQVQIERGILLEVAVAVGLHVADRRGPGQLDEPGALLVLVAWEPVPEVREEIRRPGQRAGLDHVAAVERDVEVDRIRVLPDAPPPELRERVVGVDPRGGEARVASLREGVDRDEPAGKVLERLAQLLERRARRPAPVTVLRAGVANPDGRVEAPAALDVGRQRDDAAALLDLGAQLRARQRRVPAPGTLEAPRVLDPDAGEPHALPGDGERVDVDQAALRLRHERVEVGAGRAGAPVPVRLVGPLVGDPDRCEGHLCVPVRAVHRDQTAPRLRELRLQGSLRDRRRPVPLGRRSLVIAHRDHDRTTRTRRRPASWRLAVLCGKVPHPSSPDRGGSHRQLLGRDRERRVAQHLQPDRIDMVSGSTVKAQTGSISSSGSFSVTWKHK